MNLGLTLLEAAESGHHELPFPGWVFGLIAFGILMGFLLLTMSIGKGRPHS
jgi:hypothetical protein